MAEFLVCRRAVDTLASVLFHRGRASKKWVLVVSASVSWPVSLRQITNQASALAEVQDLEVKMIETKGVVHFTIPVTEPERSAKFYSELLGMRIVHRNPQMVFLKCGGDYLVLGKGDAPIQAGSGANTTIHHAFKVSAEDFDQSVEFLKQNGVEIMRAEERDEGVFQGRSAYFRDPDGNVLEIHDSRKVGEG